MDEKEIIKELNVVFKENGWKLLPEDNIYSMELTYSWSCAILVNSLFIDRLYIPYEKHINKFTIEQLDNYVVEFIKNICLKHGIKTIEFSGENFEDNKIILK